MAFIYGTPEDDILAGTSDNDGLYGVAGNDILSGLVGHDTLQGSDGNDTLDGGSGGDRLEGGTGVDHLIGGGGDDSLSADPGDGDVVEGGAGQDLLFYGATSTTGVTVNLAVGTASGGATLSGIENVAGTLFADTLTGDAAHNILVGNSGDDVLNGGNGNDLLDGGHGRDTVMGGAGDDVLRDTAIGFSPGPDRLDGGAGNDTVDYSYSSRSSAINLAAGTINGLALLTSIENVRGTTGSDTIVGTAEANLLFGDRGQDILRGGAGDDRLQGGLDADSLYGEAGDDVLYEDIILHEILSETPELMDGGDGIDTADYSRHSHNVYLDLQNGTGLNGHLTLVSIENLRGSDFNYDSLIGNAGSNALFGNGGDDFLRGGGGADRLDGGDGIDAARYNEGGVGVAVDLSTGAATGGNAQGDVLVWIENLTGSQGNDSLTGDTNSNTLAGEAGDDVLRGGAGRDALQGGGGADVLRGEFGGDVLQGGGGADRFAFAAATDSTATGGLGSGFDRITDFSHAQGDRIDLSEIDANAGVAGNQAFTFVGNEVPNQAGELRYTISGDRTIITGNTDGVGGYDIVIELAGAIDLVAADFVL